MIKKQKTIIQIYVEWLYCLFVSLNQVKSITELQMVALSMDQSSETVQQTP